MLQRIHHHGFADGSHFAVCCGDLTSIKILTPKDGAVFFLSPESSSVLIEVTAVVLNPLESSEVYAQVQDSFGLLSPRIPLSISPGSGVIIPSGRVLDRAEPDNIAHLWAASLTFEFRGKFVISASASTFAHFDVTPSNVLPLSSRSSTLKVAA
jgi:hypothetical protein